MGTIRISNVATNITTLGPENRAVIWLQGCKRSCKGCMAPETRDLNGGKLIQVNQLAELILSFKNIEGITISGGEPFLQPESLCELISEIKNQNDLGVIIYTGFTMDELLKTDNPHIIRIVTSLADIIIDGEYIEELNDGVSLRGSSNQTVNFISNRYIPYKHLYEGNNRSVQIQLSGNTFFAVGVPSKENLAMFNKMTNQFKAEEDNKTSE